MQPTSHPTVLFLCTGNFYRSRLAEALFNAHAERANLPWRAWSRGLSPLENTATGCSPVVHETLAKLGIAPPADRPPAGLSVDDLPAAHLVVLLNESEHRPMMERRFKWMVAALEKDDRLRAWHVYDLPPAASPAWSLRTGKPAPSQPADSASEHIQLAVEKLINELANRKVATAPGNSGTRP